MRASDKMDSCNIRAALRILQTSVRAPQNTQTAAEVHALVAVDTDEHEIAQMEMQCAAVKQAAAKFMRPPAKLVKRVARGVVLVCRARPQQLTKRRHRGHWTHGGETSCGARMDGHVDQGDGPTLHSEAMDNGHDCPT